MKMKIIKLTGTPESRKAAEERKQEKDAAYEHLKHLPGYMTGFSDECPRMKGMLGESEKAASKIEESDVSHGEKKEYSEEELRQFNEGWDQYQIALEGIADQLNELKKRIFKNDGWAFAELQTIATTATRLLEIARMREPVDVSTPKTLGNVWPVLLNPLQVGWKTKGMPDNVKQIYKSLIKPASKALEDRLGVWVHAALFAILEIRKSPFNICEREGYNDLNFIEIVCRLPVLKKPFSDLSSWINAIYYAIRRDASSNVPLDGFDPVEWGACAYHLFYQEGIDPSLGDELLSVENPFLVRDDEVIEAEYSERGKENPHAYALFAPHAESSMSSFRLGLINKHTKEHKQRIQSLQSKLEGAPVPAAINLRITAEEEAHAENLKNAKCAELPQFEFDDAARSAIAYRLRKILGAAR
tara:strand:+ start:89 stop:1333 length:1245 start_codon:yes stop_codon:yes gene_type:complete